MSEVICSIITEDYMVLTDGLQCPSVSDEAANAAARVAQDRDETVYVTAYSYDAHHERVYGDPYPVAPGDSGHAAAGDAMESAVKAASRAHD